MTRTEAIKIILNTIDKDDVALFTTGFISREANHIRDRASNFYMVGSMGLLSAMGAGIALCAKDKKIAIVEGDGSAFMCLGNLAVIGKEELNNIIHIVLDNGAYGSTGGQVCVSEEIDISNIASACGYKKVETVKSAENLKKCLQRLLRGKGPVFVRVLVSGDFDKTIQRIKLTCPQIRKRFMEFLKKGAA